MASEQLVHEELSFNCSQNSWALPFHHQNLSTSVCRSRGAGLGQPTTGISVKYNDNTLKLVFDDTRRVIASAAGATLQLTGYARDAPTGLNVCFTADVRVC